MSTAQKILSTMIAVDAQTMPPPPDDIDSLVAIISTICAPEDREFLAVAQMVETLTTVRHMALPLPSEGWQASDFAVPTGEYAIYFLDKLPTGDLHRSIVGTTTQLSLFADNCPSPDTSADHWALNVAAYFPQQAARAERTSDFLIQAGLVIAGATL